MHHLCSSTARIMQFCESFAVHLQVLCHFVQSLRFACKFNVMLCNLCSSTAKAMQFAFKSTPSYSGVFLMGANGFSGGDSCGGKGKTQCRLSASLALFRMVLSGLKSVLSTFAEMEMWCGACKKPTCGLPSGVLFFFGVDGLRDERL